MKRPVGAAALWEAVGSAQSAKPDVVALFSKGTSHRVYHTQLKAGLRVVVSPATVRVGRAFTARITVKDAGDPVAGAKVTIAGRTGRTGAGGVAQIHVPPRSSAGKLSVIVTKSGYAKATAYIRVKR